MLGHVAASVGGALPGNPTATLIGSFFYQGFDNTNPIGTVPARAAFVFAEQVGDGGPGRTSSNQRVCGGGAASNDGIFSVSEGQTIRVLKNVSTRVAALVIGSTTLLSTNPGGTSAGGAGKYAGSSGSATVTGSAGGRLGGPGGQPGGINAVDTSKTGPGLGGGSYPDVLVAGTNDYYTLGGVIGTSLTFFNSYDAALAFANSLYGGNWQP